MSEAQGPIAVGMDGVAELQRLPDAQQMHDEMLHSAIEDRRNSNEVTLLNAQARGAIFGPQAPNTRARILNRDAGTPRENMIDQIRTQDRFGATQAERNEAAEEYVSEYNRLTSKDEGGEGLEPAQAKLVMDMDLSQADQKEQLKEQIKNRKYADKVGADARAEQDAVDYFVGVRDNNVQFIREHGIFSAEDYSRAAQQYEAGQEVNLYTPTAGIEAATALTPTTGIEASTGHDDGPSIVPTADGGFISLDGFDDLPPTPSVSGEYSLTFKKGAKNGNHIDDIRPDTSKLPVVGENGGSTELPALGAGDVAHSEYDGPVKAGMQIEPRKTDAIVPVAAANSITPVGNRKGTDLDEAVNRANEAELKDKNAEFRKIRDDYAKLVAKQRNAHNGHVETTPGRVGRRVKSIKKAMRLDKISIQARRDKKLDDAVNAARDIYRDNHKSLIEFENRAFGFDADTQFDRQLLDFDALEDVILTHQRSEADKQGGLGTWIADQYARGGKVRKTIMVGTIPLVAGVAVGTAVGTFGASLGVIGTSVAGAATGYLGKKEGNLIAQQANTGFIATPEGDTVHGERRSRQSRELASRLVGSIAAGEVADHTINVTASTQEALAINKARRAKAGMVAGAMASAGFIGGRIGAGTRVNPFRRRPQVGGTEANNLTGSANDANIAAREAANNTAGNTAGSTAGNTASTGAQSGERIIDAARGKGFIFDAQHGLNLSPKDAARATNLLQQNGFFDGTKIPGVKFVEHGRNAGKIVVYSRGGDGAGHLKLGADALKLLADNGIKVA